MHVGGYPGNWWQCVELAQRFYKARGWHGGIFSGVNYAYQIYDKAGSLNMSRQANGSITSLRPGDMIVHGPNASPADEGAGHVAIVASISGSNVNAVEQNASRTGRATYTLNKGKLSRAGLGNIRGVVHDPQNKEPSSPSAPSGIPFGKFESIERAPGGAAIRGWAIDPNAANAGKGSIRIDFYVGTGSIAGRNPDKQLTANVSRLDVGRAYPKYGSKHGYDGFIELRPGSQKVCAYAINVGPGSNKQIGCKTITMPDYGSEYYLNNDFDGSYDLTVGYGRGTDEVIVGDWDGDGKDTLGVRRGNQYYLNNNFDDVHDIYTGYGRSTDEVIVGDWDGDGKDTLGVRRGNQYYLNNNFDDVHDIYTGYERSTDEVIVGDWNGDGRDTLGVRRESTYYLNNDFDTQHDILTTYGKSSDGVVAGDWDGDGKDTLGVREPDNG